MRSNPSETGNRLQSVRPYHQRRRILGQLENREIRFEETNQSLRLCDAPVFLRQSPAVSVGKARSRLWLARVAHVRACLRRDWNIVTARFTNGADGNASRREVYGKQNLFDHEPAPCCAATVKLRPLVFGGWQVVENRSSWSDQPRHERKQKNWPTART